MSNRDKRGLLPEATSPSSDSLRQLRRRTGHQGWVIRPLPSANDNNGRDEDSRYRCKKTADTCSLNPVWAHQKSSMALVWLKPSSDIKVCSETETKQSQQEERPPLPDGRDGLARSFVHIANQCPVNGKRSAKRLAFGAWGLVPKW